MHLQITGNKLKSEVIDEINALAHQNELMQRPFKMMRF